MIHILKSFAAKVWAGVILLVVVSGLLVGSLRLMLPLVTDYREQLAADLSRVMQAPVRIEHLDARLAGLSPELRLSGVEILNPADAKPLLRFDELRLRVDLIDSLLVGEPRVELVTIIGARLIIRRQRDGEVFLIGLDADESDGADTYVSPAPFLSQGRLRLLGGEIVWDNRRLGVPPLRFIDVDAQLVNAGARHQLDIKGRIAGSGDGQGELRADFFGDPATPLDWSGDIYFKGSGLALAPLSEQLLPAQYQLEAEAEVELWSHWSQGRGGSLSGRIALRDLQPHGSPAGSGLERISGWLDWRREAQGWRLGLRELVLEHDGKAWPGADLAVRVRERGAAGTRVQVGAGQLWLEELAAVAQTLPIAEDWRVLLEDLQPRGELLGLKLNLQLPAAGEVRWQSAGRVAGLKLEPQGGAPGVGGLDLTFLADQEHGVVQLASEDLELRFTDLFRWPLRADRLSGELAWRPGPEGGLQISSDEIVLENRDLKTRSRLLLRLGDGGGPPFLDMQTDFSDGDGANTPRYLPSGILSAKLVAWLDRAIVSGRATSGAFIFRGPLDGFPFRDRDGRFEVLFGVEEGILDYQEGWPRIEEITAEIRFLNEGLEARLYDGKLLESQVEETRVRIADLRNSPALTIDGGVHGPFADAFRILRETPLAQRQARYVRGMQAQGKSRVELDLSIPLREGGKYQVDGRLRWNGAALLLPEWGLTLSRLKGAIAFTDKGVFANGVQARLWNDPIRLDVDTFAARRGVSGNTRIGVDLKLRPERLAQHYPHWLWSQLQGAAPGRLLLDIGHAGGVESDIPLSFRLDSELQGIEVALPTPLDKAAAEVRPLFIAGSLPFASGGRIKGGYGDIAGIFRLAAGAAGGLILDAAEVSCGSERPPALQGAGFRLTGSLPKVDLAAWGRWLAAHGSHFESRADENRQSPSQRVDLLIEELLLPKGSLSNLQLGMVRTPNAWEAELAADQLRGSVRLPDDPRAAPISVQLESLRLDLDAWGLESAAADSTVWPDPRQAPGLFLDVEQLYLGGRPFGRLRLQMEPVPDGLRLEQLELDGPLVTLKGSGGWSGTPSDQQTRLSLEAQSPDLGKVTRELQFTTAIDQAEMTMQADLQWHAPPLEVDLANLEGVLEFHVGKGRVLDVNPGVGRLFGLLNLGALQRRLTLDFSDLFKKGYAFDRIDGRFILGGGVAEAEQVSIAGPAANLEITGRAGLLTRDYDQLVTVTPEISVTLPLAGAIVGGPVVAAALMVADQVMGEEVNKLIRYQYRVTGPWSDPEIVRIETQDGWSLSNLLQPAAESEQVEPSGPAAEEEGFFVH